MILRVPVGARTRAGHLTKVALMILEGMFEEMSPLEARRGMRLKLLIHDRIRIKGMFAKFLPTHKYYIKWPQTHHMNFIT